MRSYSHRIPQERTFHALQVLLLDRLRVHLRLPRAHRRLRAHENAPGEAGGAGRRARGRRNPGTRVSEILGAGRFTIFQLSCESIRVWRRAAEGSAPASGHPTTTGTIIMT